MNIEKTKEIEELKARLSELEASVKEDEQKEEAPKKRSGDIIGFVVIGIVALVLISILSSILMKGKEARKTIREMGLNNPILDRLVMQYYDSDLTKREVIKILQDRGYSRDSIEEAIDALW